MKIIPILIIFCTFSFQLSVFATRVDTFPDGTPSAQATLSIPIYQTTVNITVPADYRVLSAKLCVTASSSFGEYALSPEISLNSTLLWAFNGTGYGPFGMQDRFSSGANQTRLQFGPAGGQKTATIRLPKEAFVENATLGINVSGSLKIGQTANLASNTTGEFFGMAVSNAGDLNGDGYDDVIVGTTASFTQGPGHAYIFFGGKMMNATPDMVLTGADKNDNFGYSASGAGDVNNDGCDDVIVGAYNNASGAGSAYIFYGGQPMNNISDVSFSGGAKRDRFGCSVSGAGDVNADGFDDVIVGAYWNCSAGCDTGSAYVYFGGKPMDNISDVVFTNDTAYGYFGWAVSKAGDVNQDGYDDVIVGSFLLSTPLPGRAFIYFGGQPMDNKTDVLLSEGAKAEYFGVSVSDAGDVNGDGYGDVIVGAPSNVSSGGIRTGGAWIYFGGPSMDSKPEVALSGIQVDEEFGKSVSAAGDLNGDGYGDVIVGALTDAGGMDNAGRVYVFFGGAAMDSASDIQLDGSDMGDSFGDPSSEAGDVNGDGRGDLLIGASGNDSAGSLAGRAFIYSPFTGILNPNITLGSGPVWNRTGPYNSTDDTTDFAGALNAYMRARPQTGKDSFGNSYLDVPFNISARSEGNITLSNLSIRYRYNATVPDFAVALNDYRVAHAAEKDSGGNLSVPLTIRAQSAGELLLFGLNITYDGAPWMVKPIPDLEMDEDTVNESLLDLTGYFMDDFTAAEQLDFKIADATNSSIVSVSITGNRYLAADALTGEQNDNWTGRVSLTVRCTDSRGSGTVSNQFDIIIRNVNDPPLITSTPPANATVGIEYRYQLIAVDGDNDTLAYTLVDKPQNMAITGAGQVIWTPTLIGNYSVSIAVSDGRSMVFQNFSIEVVPGTGSENHLPAFSSVPVTTATVGVQYTYDADALDGDNDALTFSLGKSPSGMSINTTTGLLSWMPAQSGTYDVSVAVTDGKASVFQNFCITVTGASTNRDPVITSLPPANATAGQPYYYDVKARDDDNDTLGFSVQNLPAGMSIDAATGRINWTPSVSQIGNHTINITVSDGRGGRAGQTFVIRVWDVGGPVIKPGCAITSHASGTTVSGKVALAGKATKGTAAIAAVQIRIDGGPWSNGRGTENWTYVLDTQTLKNGPHSVEVRAFDGSLYSDPASILLNVDNPTKVAMADSTPYWILVAVVLATVVGALCYRQIRKKKAIPPEK
jgi:hypothetical protein